MPKNFALTLVIGLTIGAVLLAAPFAGAQSVLNLPRDSQRAQVMQRVGITDITISYHRPLIRGRKVWGDLVPYGQVWRAGANENTTIEFADPVSIEGKPLPKGIYGLFMIPGESEWTVIFSKNSTSWGHFTYDQAEDALRVAVKPQPADFHEALAYDFDDLKPDSTVVTLRWEKLAVPFTVGVNVNEVMQQSLRDQLRAWSRWMWEGYDEAANYLLTHRGNLEDALQDANGSIQVEERFDNLLTESRVLDALGRKDEAAAALNKALSLANAQQLYSYARLLQSQGKQEKAFEVFRMDIQQHSGEWIVHAAAARLACAQGDFTTAVKEMKLAAAGAPDQVKSIVEGLVRRLEARQDINK